MEMLDILNSDGTLAGYTVSKKEAHEKGLKSSKNRSKVAYILIGFIVAVLIYN